MSNRIIANPDTAHGKMAVELADLIYSAQTLSKRLLNAVGQMSYGAPADYAQVAAEFGFVDSLGKTAAQKAADFASLLTSADTALSAGILGEFVSRIEQG